MATVGSIKGVSTFAGLRLCASLSVDASHSLMMQVIIVFLQARHIPLAPGKEHFVEVGGTHISTASSSSMWNLEGCVHFNIYSIMTF